MVGTQNETFQKSGKPKAESRRLSVQRSAFRFPPSAFTLTELLVVITIIGILASLITGAALRAMGRAKQAAITLELQGIDGAVIDLKNELSVYPPNCITPNGATNAQLNAVGNDLDRFRKKLASRYNEAPMLRDKLIGITTHPGQNLQNGISAAEAVVFWFGGFSDDSPFPFSGPCGPSFGDTNGVGGVTLEDEILENRNWGKGFSFDLGRLGPRDANGQFNGRYIEYEFPVGSNTFRRINFWTYTPQGSEQPMAYFDTSNITPDKRFNGVYNYELRSSANPNDSTAPVIFPLRQRLETVPDTVTNPTVDQTKYVNQGKFQLLHCGTDDIWGDFSVFSHDISGTNSLLYPEGPFIGDIGDTLGNFITGTLEDEQE